VIYARQPDAWYVEEAWCAERLFQDEVLPGRIVDPCAGRGTIVRAGLNAGLRIEGYDLRDRGSPVVRGGYDFFEANPTYLHGTFPCDCIVSNPPYTTWAQVGRDRPDHIEHARLDDAFLDLALQRARVKVCLFLPTGWINAEKRSRWLKNLPFYREYKLSPRPSCPPGEYLEAGKKAAEGRVDFSWFVFLHGYQGHPSIHWLRRDE
jgi:hypothetical protein